MSKTLKTLIKLYKIQLDEKQLIKSKLELQKEQLTALLDKLRYNLQQEKLFCQENQLLLTIFAKYETSNIYRQNILLKEINEINQQIDEVIEEIYLAFAELKKYEITLKNYVENEQKLQLKREQMILDELNTNKAILRNKNH